jgi:spore germination protein GerM
MKAHNRTPIATPVLIGFFLLLIGVTQITALWALSKVIFSTFTRASTPTVEEVQPAKLSPQIYQLEIVDNSIQLTPKSVYTAATSRKLALTEALGKLLAQSSTPNSTTTIPSKTRLLNLDVNKDGVYVDLSQEFAEGGGSSSMIYRVAQVLYTSTSIDPQTPVFLSIEGKPLDDNNPLGGEGLTLDYPITRQQFERDFLAEY